MKMNEMTVVQNFRIRDGQPGCNHPLARRRALAENRGAKCLTASVVCLDCDAKQLVAIAHNDAPGDEGRATDAAREAAW